MALPAEKPFADEPPRHPGRNLRAKPLQENLEQLLAHWPGPAAILDHEGDVLAGNIAAPPVLAALADRPGGLAGLLIVGAAFKIAVTVPGLPAAQTYEVVPLPFGDRLVLLARDISLSIQVCAALADSRQRYKDLVGISTDFAWETDASGTFVFVSPQGGLGYLPAELIGRDGASLLLEPPIHNAASPFGTTRAVLAEEVWMRRIDGGAARMLMWAIPVAATDHPFAGARGVCRDVTAAVERETALLEISNRERLLERIMRAMRDEGDASVVFRATATTLAQAVGADGASIWRGDVAGFRAIATFGAPAPAEFDGPRVLLPRLEAADDKAVAVSGSAGAALALATSHRRARNGAVTLWRNSDRGPWNAAEQALVGAVAVQVGIGLALTALGDAATASGASDAPDRGHAPRANDSRPVTRS
jgi:PAS domain S-box-containing protein